MIIPAEWPIGTEYAVVQIVTHKTASGIPDPSISERACLPGEVRSVIRRAMERNPYCTAYLAGVRTWRGLP